jgi:hypothetical protein
MRLRLINPTLLPELIEFLDSRTDMVTKRVAENEIEVSLLGSYGRDGERMTLELLLRAWEAARNTEGQVEVLD